MGLMESWLITRLVNSNYNFIIKATGNCISLISKSNYFELHTSFL